MKKLAVVICNYNKKDYLLKCIDSVLESSYKDLDVYVVDNASKDGSSDSVRENFSKKVILINNKQNLGGSGGFNTGIKEALKKKYKYIMLLDNDVIIEKSAIENSFNYLERNLNTAVVGSKIYSMDNKDKIQEMGARIDFENFYINPLYKGYTDSRNFPEVVQCDYVPACSMMIRMEALKKVGIMDEGNFIYWDDIDFGYRFKMKGYKVSVYSKSVVWHKMGVAQRINTFGTYYFWRNRINFFIKYIEKDKIERFSFKIFDEVMQAVYSCNYIGKYNSAITILTAVDDAINNVRGKADENKILELEKIEDRFEKIIKDKKNIVLLSNVSIEILRNTIEKINNLNCTGKLSIACSNIKEIKEQFKGYEVLDLEKVNFKDYETSIKLCNHIFDVRNNMKKDIVYTDRFFNVISSESDREYVSNYDCTYNLLKRTWYPVFKSKIKMLNDKLSQYENQKNK
ncbi:glycosyl transferase [Clostridium acetobutylicum]|nr:glycosyl transferase [Clostridium acetobutylicum]